MSETNESVPAAQLQLSDILLAAHAISLASQRGAFKVEEFTQIGGCFDRITTFLRDSGAITPPTESEQPAEQPAK
jgi:hypothetical protein